MILFGLEFGLILIFGYGFYRLFNNNRSVNSIEYNNEGASHIRNAPPKYEDIDPPPSYNDVSNTI